MKLNSLFFYLTYIPFQAFSALLSAVGNALAYKLQSSVLQIKLRLLNLWAVQLG